MSVDKEDMLGFMLEMVERFNREIIGLPIPETPTMITGQRLKHAQEHLLEEVNELATAQTVHDQADAIIDLVYVALGRLIEMGIAPRAAFEEVHDANMRKQRGPTAKRPNSKGHDAVKPPGWAPPDLTRILRVSRADIDAMPQVLIEVSRLRAQKGGDYNEGVKLTDYFPFGHFSYMQMLHVKNSRLRSLVAVLQKGKQPSYEGLRDTLLDLINYSSFYVEWIDQGQHEAQIAAQQRYQHPNPPPLKQRPPGTAVALNPIDAAIQVRQQQ